MPDTETTVVPPALTAREWAEIRALPPETREHFLTRDPAAAARAMALNNFALPDGDPRKITRADLAWLDEFAADCHTEESRAWHAHFCAKIDALLQPE